MYIYLYLYSFSECVNPIKDKILVYSLDMVMPLNNLHMYMLLTDDFSCQLDKENKNCSSMDSVIMRWSHWITYPLANHLVQQIKNSDNIIPNN